MSDDFSTPARKTNTALIIVIVILVILCCCCAALTGIAWTFGDNFLNWFGFY